MADLPTVARALEHARALGVARLDAQLLLAHVLSQPRAWLIAHDDALLTQAAQGTIAAQLGRRANGEPLAYITGTREFHGLLLHVTPDVLIPRPDSETLIETSALLASRNKTLTIAAIRCTLSKRTTRRLPCPEKP